MDTVLTGLSQFAKGYTEDIIIWSNTTEDHMQHVKTVLDRLVKHKLTIKLSKTKVFQRETRFCGFKVSKEGIGPWDKKIAAIKAFPSPNDQPDNKKRVKALMSFI